MRLKLIIVFALTLLFVIVFCNLSISKAQSNEDLSAISAARGRLITCFKAAQLAESAGANISSLTMKLNDAGKLLSDAEFAYLSGDSSRVQSLALESQHLLNNFESEADSLRVIQAANMDFLVNILGSIIGTIVVIIGSIFVWRMLKKKYASGEV